MVSAITTQQRRRLEIAGAIRTTYDPRKAKSDAWREALDRARIAFAALEKAEREFVAACMSGGAQAPTQRDPKADPYQMPP